MSQCMKPSKAIVAIDSPYPAEVRQQVLENRQDPRSTTAFRTSWPATLSGCLWPKASDANDRTLNAESGTRTASSERGPRPAHPPRRRTSRWCLGSGPHIRRLQGGRWRISWSTSSGRLHAGTCRRQCAPLRDRPHGPRSPGGDSSRSHRWNRLAVVRWKVLARLGAREEPVSTSGGASSHFCQPCCCELPSAEFTHLLCVRRFWPQAI